MRDALLRRGLIESGFVRHAYRPFDTRWLYWESEGGLLDRPRSEYKPHVFERNLSLGSSKREIHDNFSNGTLVHHLGNWKLGNWGIHFFPAWLREEGLGLGSDGRQRRPNLSPVAQRYLERLGLGVEDLFHHVLAVLHDPAYREANAGALRMEWPRIPLPGWPNDDAPGRGGRTGGVGGPRSGTDPTSRSGKRQCPASLPVRCALRSRPSESLPPPEAKT